MKRLILTTAFTVLMVGGPALMAQPEPGANRPQPPRSTQVKIEALERELDQQSGKFDWRIHNELRHLHSGFDERQTYYHSDVILKHSVMDDYILSILSGWQIKDNRPKAVENLQQAAVKYPEFPFLAAACLLKAGDLEEDASKAAALYRRVIDMRGPSLAGYRKLAEGALGKLPPIDSGTDLDTPVTPLEARKSIRKK